MSSSSAQAEVSECHTCKKTASELNNPTDSSTSLKRCGQCHTVAYCSRDCQKADWKSHKQNCLTDGKQSSKGPTSSSSSSSSQQQQQQQYTLPCRNPLLSLVTRGVTPENLLKNIPEKEVYSRLIDAFRLRVEDEYVFNGEVTGVYAQRDPMPEFRRFLNLVERRGGILPSWWNAEKRKECEQAGRCGRTEWTSLSCAVEKSDIQEHYKDNVMPMKLRMLAEVAYGSHVVKM